MNLAEVLALVGFLGVTGITVMRIYRLVKVIKDRDIVTKYGELIVSLIGVWFSSLVIFASAMSLLNVLSAFLIVYSVVLSLITSLLFFVEIIVGSINLNFGGLFN